MIHIENLKMYGDAPPNFLRDPNVGTPTKKLKSWGLNSQHFKGRRACWSFKMGLG
jgi:hypothetical protein